MKKTSKTLLKVITVTIACLSFQTCEYWKNGDKFYNDVQEQVRVAGADKITVDCSYAQSNWGSINPGMGSEQKIEVPFKVTQVPVANYAFHHWAAFRKSDFSKKTSTLFWDDDSVLRTDGTYKTNYELNWEPHEIKWSPDENDNENVVKFFDYDLVSATKGLKKDDILEADEKNEINDIGVYIRKKLYTTDASGKEVEDPIVIVPVVAKRMTLDSNRINPEQGNKNVVRNQRITIAFNKKIDFETFVDTTLNDSEEKRLYINNKTYGWNKDAISIRFTDDNGKVNDDPYDEYFELPVYDDKKPKQLTISVKKPMPQYNLVEITIAATVQDQDGFSMAEDILYTFKIGSKADNDPPVLTELSGGRNIDASKLKINQISSVRNWLEYSGYKDNTGALDSTKADPTDPTNSTDLTHYVPDPENEVIINEYLSNRVTDSVNIYLVIKDQIDGRMNDATIDSDISYFTVRSRLLVDSQGNPPKDENGNVIQGGKIYENELIDEDNSVKFKAGENDIRGLNYDKLKYSSNTFEFFYCNEEIPELYNVPADERLPGYGFTYKFPTALPDGLIKIEIFAVDVTENSGKDIPFALYVVKDTTKPSVEDNGPNIICLADSVISEWFNSRTKKDLEITVRENSPIVDNACELLQPSVMYWSFSPTETAPSNVWDIIDNEGLTTKKMDSFAQYITQEGRISIYAQLSDDLGNISEIKKMDFNGYYDVTAPGTVNIERLIEPEKIHRNGNTFFTKENIVKYEFGAVDSEDNFDSTETSSGIAGFLSLDNAERSIVDQELKNVNTEEKSLVNLIKANGGKASVTLNTGDTADKSKRTYYLYSVDRALNASEQNLAVTLIQDTTGPEITVTDSTSCVYNAQKPYYRTSDTLNEIESEAGVTGYVKGISNGTYYFGNSVQNIPFTVTLKDYDFNNGGYASGEKSFVWQKEGASAASNEFESGSVIELGAGNYKIIAKDNLGNITESPVIRIVKDSNVPEVSLFKLYEADGTTVLPLTADGVASVKTNKIGVQFKVKDSTTGIRQLEFVTGDYTNAKLYVNGEEFTSQTGIHTGNKYIFKTCLAPATEYTIMVKDVVLPEVEAEIQLSVKVTDPTGNGTTGEADGSFAKINFDNRAPVITGIYFVNEGSSEEITDFNQQTVAQKFKIDFTEGLSGVKYIYVNVTNSSDPFASAAFAVTAEGLSQVAMDSSDSQKCLLSNALYPADRTGGSLTLVLNALTIDSTVEGVNHEGTKTVTVKLEDAAGNVSAAKTLNVIYDTTGPAITIDDNSSYEYSAGKFFRSSDTEVTKPSTGTDSPVTNNEVSGLIAESEKYFYSLGQSYVTFSVNIQDDAKGCRKNLYYYDGKKNGVEQADPGYNGGYYNSSSINLSEGTHVIYAKDLLGNVTKSPVITVVQDKAVPVTTDVVIYGKDKNNVEQTTSSVTSVVDIGVALKDIDTANNDTGIRSFTVSGDAKFTAPAVISRTVGTETVTLTKDTDYFVTGANETSSETITFKYTQPSLSTYRFSGAILYLESGEGINTIYCDVKDSTGNESVTADGSIFCDSTAPVITNAAVVTIDTTGKTNNNSTKTDNVKITFNVTEPVSGLTRIYAVKTNASTANIPTGQSMLVSSSTLTGSQTAGTIDSTNGFIKFNEPSISANAQSVELSHVTFDEGDKAYTIYLFALDDAGNLSAPVAVNVNYDTTAPVVNEITINDILKLHYYEDAEDKYILPSSVFSGNDAAADKVPVYVEFTETLSGIEFINVGGTAVIQDNTELYIVNGTTETPLVVGTDYELDLSSNKIHMLNSAEPLLKSDTTVKIKLSNIKFNKVDSNDANTISVTLKDFAINQSASCSDVTSGSFAGIQNIYADSKKPVISTLIAVDRGGNADSGNLMAGDTTDAINKTTANAGYTNENIVNVKITVNAETTSSVTGSGIKSIGLTGADFTADTKVWLNENEPHHLSTEVSFDESSRTVIFTNAIKNAYTVTITNVKLSTGDGTKTLSAVLKDAVGWISDSQSYSIILDTANPVWNVNEVFAAPYSDCNEKVYPHPNSETAFGRQFVTNGPRYFYTSYKMSGLTKAVLGLHMTDANLRSAATGVYVKAADTTNADVIKSGSVKSAALNSTGFVKTNYSYWADFAPSSTIYTVAVMDEAGNISEAKQFYVVEDITAPSAKDDSENFIDFTYVEQNNEADGERWEIFTVPVGTNYKNIFKSNGGNFTEHVKIEVPLSNYMERSFSATYSGIEYYAVTDGAAPSSEQKSSSYAYGKWMNFTEGSTSLTIYPDMYNDRDALFLHFKDGAGNIKSIPVRTKTHAEANENVVESWSIDDSINYDGNDDSISSLSGKTDSLSTVGNLVNDDGYFMTDETAGLNYISGNAKLHLTIKEDKSFTSSAIENNSENYSIKARIVISESEPTKSYIDNLTAEDVTSQITQDWKYIGTTNSEAIEFVLEYPTAANESKLWLCIEDRVGNFTAEKIIFKYDQSNPDSDYAEKWTYDNEAPTVVVTKGGVTKEVEDIEATFDDIQFLISPNGIKRAYCGKNNSGQKHIWVPSSGSLKYNFTANDNTNSIKGYKYLTSETEPALNTYNNYSDNWNNIYYSELENNSDKDIYLFIRDYVGNVRMYHIGNEDVKFRKDDVNPTDGSGTEPVPVTKKDRYRISKRSGWNTYEIKTAGINMDNDDILTVINGRKYLKVYIPYYFNPERDNNNASGICGYSYSTSASEWSSITGDNLYTEEEPDPYVLIPQEIAKNETGTNVNIYLYDNVGNKDYFSVKVICDNTPPEFSVKILPYYTGTNIFDKNIYKKSTFNDNVTEFTYPMSLEGLSLTEDQKKAYDITKPENAVNFYSKGYLQLEFYTTSDDCYESKFEFGTYDSTTKTFTPKSGDAKTTISAANIKKDGTNFYPAGDFISANTDGWNTYARASLTDDAGNTTSYYFRFEIDNSAPIMKFDSFYMNDGSSAIGNLYTELTQENPVLSTTESAPSIFYKKATSDSWIQIKQDVEIGSGIAKYVAYYRDGTSGSWNGPSDSGYKTENTNTIYGKKVYSSVNQLRENKIEVYDYLGNCSVYYFQIITDTTAPSVDSQFIENHVCTDSSDYYISSSGWNSSSKQINVYSQQSNITLNLKTAESVGSDSQSGLKGFSLSADFASFESIASINITEGINNFYLYDNLGNRKECKINLIKDNTAPQVTISSTPVPVSGKNIYPSNIQSLGTTEDTAAKYYINSISSSDYVTVPLSLSDVSGVKSRNYNVNNANSNTFTSSVKVYANTTDGASNIVAITVEDNVKNEKTYYLNLQSDVTAPVISAITDSSYSGIINKGENNGNSYNYYNGTVGFNNTSVEGLKKSEDWFVYGYMDPVTVTTDIVESEGSGLCYIQIGPSNVKKSQIDDTNVSNEYEKANYQFIKQLDINDTNDNLIYIRNNDTFEFKLPDVRISEASDKDYPLYIYVEDVLGNSSYVQLRYDNCLSFINDYTIPSVPGSTDISFSATDSNNSEYIYSDNTLHSTDIFVNTNLKGEALTINFVPSVTDGVQANDSLGAIKGIYAYINGLSQYDKYFIDGSNDLIVPVSDGKYVAYRFIYADYAGNVKKSNIANAYRSICFNYDNVKPVVTISSSTSTADEYNPDNLLSNDADNPTKYYLKSTSASLELSLKMTDKDLFGDVIQKPIRKLLYKKTTDSVYTDVTSFTYPSSTEEACCSITLENSGNEASPYTYEIKAVDKTGNECDPIYVSVIPDVTAPEITLNSFATSSGTENLYTTLVQNDTPSISSAAPSEFYYNGSVNSKMFIKFKVGEISSGFDESCNSTCTYINRSNNGTGSCTKGGEDFKITTENNNVYVTIGDDCFDAEIDYTLTVKDKVGNENIYYINVIPDKTAPTVTQFAANKACASPTDYYISSNGWNASDKQLTVYSQSASVNVVLTQANIVGTDTGTGIKGFSLSNDFAQFNEIHNVEVSAGNENIRTFYLFDNIGNKTECKINLVQDTTPPKFSEWKIEKSTNSSNIKMNPIVLEMQSCISYDIDPMPTNYDDRIYCWINTGNYTMNFKYKVTPEELTVDSGIKILKYRTKKSEASDYSEYTDVTNLVNSQQTIQMPSSTEDNGKNLLEFYVEDNAYNSATYYYEVNTDLSVPVIDSITFDRDIIKTTATSASEKIPANTRITDASVIAEIGNSINNTYITIPNEQGKITVSIEYKDIGSGMSENTGDRVNTPRTVSVPDSAGNMEFRLTDKVGNQTYYTMRYKKDAGVTAATIVNTADGKRVYTDGSNTYFYAAEVNYTSDLALEKYAVSTSPDYSEPEVNSLALPEVVNSKLYLHYKDILGKTGVKQIGSANTVFICDKNGPELTGGLIAANNFSTSSPYYSDGIFTGNAETGYAQEIISANGTLSGVSFADSVMTDSESGFAKILDSSTYNAEADSLTAVDLTAGTENDKTLYFFDNVGNSTAVKLSLTQSTASLAVQGFVVAANDHYTTSNRYSTEGNGTASNVTIYSKDDSVDVTLAELTSANVTGTEGSVLGYSSTQPAYTAISGNTISVNEGNENTVYIFNKYGNFTGFTITLVKDDSAPSVSMPVASHTYSDEEPYAVSSEYWTANVLTVKTTTAKLSEIGSVILSLSETALNDEGESTILGYSSSDTEYNAITGIAIGDIDTTGGTQLYAWDKAGNVTSFTIAIDAVDTATATIDTTSASITAVTAADSANSGYIYMNGTTIYYNGNHIDETADLIYTVEGLAGGITPYSVTGKLGTLTLSVTDAVGVTASIESGLTFTSDATGPVVDMSSSSYKVKQDSGTLYEAVDNVVGENYTTDYYTSETQLQIPVSDTAGVVKYGLIIDGADSISSGTPDVWYDAVVSGGNITVGLPVISMYHKHVFLVLKDAVGNVSYKILGKPGKTNYTWWCPYIKATKAPEIKSVENTKYNNNDAIVIKIEGFTVTSPISKIVINGNTGNNFGAVNVQSYTANQNLSANYNSNTITFNKKYILKEDDVLEIYFQYANTQWANNQSIKCYDITGAEIKSSSGSPSGSAFSFSQNLTAVKNTKNAITSVAENFTSVFAPVEVPETQKVIEVTGPEFVRKQLTETFLSITPASEPKAKPVKSLLNGRKEIVPYKEKNEKGTVKESHLRNFAEEAENEISELSSIQNNSFLDEEEAVEVKALNVPEIPVISAPAAENSAQNRKLSAWFKIAAGIAMLALGITLLVKQAKKRRENGDI